MGALTAGATTILARRSLGLRRDGESIRVLAERAVGSVNPRRLDAATKLLESFLGITETPQRIGMRDAAVVDPLFRHLARAASTDGPLLSRVVEMAEWGLFRTVRSASGVGSLRWHRFVREMREFDCAWPSAACRPDSLTGEFLEAAALFDRDVARAVAQDPEFDAATIVIDHAFAIAVRRHVPAGDQMAAGILVREVLQAAAYFYVTGDDLASLIGHVVQPDLVPFPEIGEDAEIQAKVNLFVHAVGLMGLVREEINMIIIEAERAARADGHRIVVR